MCTFEQIIFLRWAFICGEKALFCWVPLPQYNAVFWYSHVSPKLLKVTVLISISIMQQICGRTPKFHSKITQKTPLPQRQQLPWPLKGLNCILNTVTFMNCILTLSNEFIELSSMLLFIFSIFFGAMASSAMGALMQWCCDPLPLFHRPQLWISSTLNTLRYLSRTSSVLGYKIISKQGAQGMQWKLTAFSLSSLKLGNMSHTNHINGFVVVV